MSGAAFAACRYCCRRETSGETRARSVAEERRHEIEARFRAADPTHPIEAVKLESQISKTIERGVELFLSDKRSQGLDEHVLKKYDRELTRFREFMAKRSKFFRREIALDDLTEFRAIFIPHSETRSTVRHYPHISNLPQKNNEMY